MSLTKDWISVDYTQSFSQESTSNKKVKTKDCNAGGTFPVVDQGQKNICGYIDDQDKVIEVETPLVIFGDHTRLIKWIDFNFVPGADGTKVLKPKNIFDPRFFYYQMRSIDLPDKGYSRHFKFLKEIDFKVPPLNEQKRIAKKLDELLATVESIKTRLDNAPTIIKRFRQSILAAATSGKLTEEWRGENKYSNNPGKEFLKNDLKIRYERFLIDQEKLILARKIKKVKKFKEPTGADINIRKINVPDSWVVASVSQAADCLDNLRIPIKKENRESSHGTYPYFGANGEVDRVDDFIIDDDIVLVTEDETFYGREKPIAYKFIGKCWVNNHVHVLRATNSTTSSYLYYSLMYYNVIPWLTGTTGRAKLSQGALNALPIGIPSLEEQKEIVSQVESLFALADTLEEKIESAKKRVDKLTQSILAKAFRGELVEQDPNDESAEKLLERIKAEQEKEKPKKSRRKKG